MKFLENVWVFLKCILFSQISSFSSCLEGKGFLFFPQDQKDTAKKWPAAPLSILYIHFWLQCQDVLYLNLPKEYRAETLEGQHWCWNHIQGLICWYSGYNITKKSSQANPACLVLNSTGRRSHVQLHSVHSHLGSYTWFTKKVLKFQYLKGNKRYSTGHICV